MAAGGHSTPLRERMLLTNTVATGSTTVHHDTHPMPDDTPDEGMQEMAEAIMLSHLGRDGDAVCVAFDMAPSVADARAVVERVLIVTTTAAADIETERMKVYERPTPP